MTLKGYVSVVVVILLLGGLLAYMNHSSSQPPAPPLPPPSSVINAEQISAHWADLLKVAAAPPKGSPNAPYTMVEIGDFQCPSCGESRALIEAALKSSHGKACLYFVNYPLTQIHPHAIVAAKAGLYAASQGKFWPMYDMLYSHQDELIPSEIEYYARDLHGINPKKLATAMGSSKYDASLQASIAYSKKIGITNTPTVFVKDPKGHVSIYFGTEGGDYNGPNGKLTGKGTADLAADPPWGNGIGPAARQILKQEQDAAQAAAR